MLTNMDGLIWLLLLVGPFLLLQREVHFEIQAVLLLLFRRRDIVFVIFSLIFLPGVLIHELSHFITARLLGVRTGKFSIIPRQMGDGRLQMGSVETEAADIFRDSLIGIAPLVAGGISVIYIARARMGFDLITGILFSNPASWFQSLKLLINMPDFWLWFYFIFSISSTMLPSASDRRAWLPLLIVLLLILAVGIILGIGSWLLLNIAPAVNNIFKALTIVFAVSSIAHLILLMPIGLLRISLSKFLKLNVR